MREFGLAVGASTLFFSIFLYSTGNDLSMDTNGNCSGECYQEYVAQFGDVVEHEKRKQQLAAGDPFSDIPAHRPRMSLNRSPAASCCFLFSCSTTSPNCVTYSW